MDTLKEKPGLGPLDDPVVISRTEGDDFRHSQLRQLARVGALPLSRVIDASRPR